MNMIKDVDTRNLAWRIGLSYFAKNDFDSAVATLNRAIEHSKTQGLYVPFSLRKDIFVVKFFAFVYRLIPPVKS
jgi:hypothetical protein